MDNAQKQNSCKDSPIIIAATQIDHISRRKVEFYLMRCTVHCCILAGVLDLL
jgi:hypothetical protein